MNENISDALGSLENDKTTHERKIELDMKKLFFNPPFFARSFMPIEEIERRESQLEKFDPNPIVNTIAHSCESEVNEAVREMAYDGLSLVALQMGSGDNLRESMERPQIVQLCIDALSDDNILIRSHAIETIGYIASKSVIPKLTELVDDPTVIPPPTPLTPEEVESRKKEEQLSQRTIGEVAKDALARLQKKVKVAEVLKMRKRKGLDKEGQK